MISLLKEACVMKRHISNRLLAWKDNPKRKPLILEGARQVGKTYSVKEFAQGHFDNYLELNLEYEPNLADIFKHALNPDDIIKEFELRTSTTIHPDHTLIFLDEVQASERALTALKYFQEKAPQYHLVAAGSVLGLAVSEKRVSYPVGKVDILAMYPMNFEEFLWSAGEAQLANHIRTCFTQDKFNTLHEKALRLYRDYLVCGGMPEAVKNYHEADNLTQAQLTHRTLEKMYLADIAKYAPPTEVMRIRDAWNSLPGQLLRENRKFKYSSVVKGGRADAYRYPLAWLEAANMVNRCKQVSTGTSPLRAHESSDFFKLYLHDTGLLTTLYGASPQSVLTNSIESSHFKGALAENYLMQQLCANNTQTWYWGRSGNPEVDFVIQNKDAQAIPIEVKSSDNVRSRSLNIFSEKYHPALSVRISSKNFGFAKGIKSVPLYAAHCITEEVGT